MSQTETHLGHRFKQLYFLIEQSMNRRLEELDLTNAQGYVIGLLTHSEEPPCARDFETRFRLSHATVSGILSRMESKGFIEQRPDPKDRRVKRIYLLERGRACSKEICLHIEEHEKTLSRGFSEEELTLFRSFLLRAEANLSGTDPRAQIHREE